MHIYISEEAVVRDIQDRFQAIYPYLKLEFFKKPHVKGEGSPKSDRISPDTPIEKIRMLHSFGWLDISYYRTAAALEHDLSYTYGLSAQVLRKSGNLWLETTGTDSWTLEELNNAGRAAKSPTFNLPEDPIDE
ncbi:hypothetical protein HGH93_19700 [Chitinophaga polysaccharea]|uniref:hypothetical protein n=1 Tax=Chitinophaga TaxID=79328 RepID=UPI0014551FBF|nr:MULTISPECIES: hypothetical protein [Chitinophaga]NLR60346.1 hypothetical protein [Chitinophaga polysaccharea]NLU95987.1 hypothetical protein [Chitinophaga sp. Ak27]